MFFLASAVGEKRRHNALVVTASSLTEEGYNDMYFFQFMEIGSTRDAFAQRPCEARSWQLAVVHPLSNARL